ncbi:MAG TPA: (2Fe-2S) ferredoxin domain-containing protein [Oculatellaceae cyanobacterium]
MRKKVFVCTQGSSCKRLGGEELYQHLRACSESALFVDHFKIKRSGCLDLCKHGPALWVKKDGVKYGAVTNLIGNLILEHHLKKKKPMKDLFYKKSKKKK